MKGPIQVIAIGVVLFFLSAGCSKEEQPAPPPRKPKVVKPIIKPPPREAAPAQAPEVKEPTALEPAAVDDKSRKAGGPKPPEKKAAPEEDSGYYIAKGGESLSGIAKNEAVYGDALKWPLLYRLNMDKLGGMPPGDDFPERALSAGLKLKLFTPDEVKENLEKRPKKAWVVNILSSMTNEEIVPAAVKLMQERYPVYITSARVKGKDWMRLRLGFFKNKKEADGAGKKIKALINAVDSWSTKAGEMEIEAYRGY